LIDELVFLLSIFLSYVYLLRKGKKKMEERKKERRRRRRKKRRINR